LILRNAKAKPACGPTIRRGITGFGLDPEKGVPRNAVSSGCRIFWLAHQSGVFHAQRSTDVTVESQMDPYDALKKQIKQIAVENLMLRMTAEDIKDDAPLFGPEGLGLDSVDALQLVVALDKHFGLKISDAQAAREILRSVTSMAEAVARHQGAAAPATLG
jgi:acyl carrier protein